MKSVVLSKLKVNKAFKIIFYSVFVIAVLFSQLPSIASVEEITKANDIDLNKMNESNMENNFSSENIKEVLEDKDLLKNIENFIEKSASSNKSKASIKNTVSSKLPPKRLGKRKYRLFNKLLGASTKEIKNSCLYNIEEIGKKYKKFLSGIKDVNERLTAVNRLAFMHGKCLPVVVVPGLFASRLNAVINCPKFMKNDKVKKEVEFYCGKDVCPDPDKDGIKSYDFWPNLNQDGFYMKLGKNNPNNSCFGYFASYYNTPNSCNNPGSDKICNYTKHVRIVPYGADIYAGDKNTYDGTQGSKFNCGFGGVNNILAITGGKFVASRIRGVKGWAGIYQHLQIKGLDPGFSLAAAPYDWKEAFCKNKNLKDTLKSLINRLHENTGKKVVIIAHSYGNLNVVDFLASNPETKNKVAHYISIAPPFGGAPKGDLLLTRGSSEFYQNMKLFEADYSRFAQSLSFPFIVSGSMLRANDYLKSIRSSKKDLYDALLKTFANDECRAKNGEKDASTKCKDGLLLADKYPHLFGWMKDDQIKGYLKTNKELYTKYFKDVEGTYNVNAGINPIYDPTYFKLYNYHRCPLFRKNEGKKEFKKGQEKELIKEMCSNKDKNRLNYYTLDSNDCGEEKKQCATNFIKEFLIRPYNYKDQVKKLCQLRYKKDECKEEAEFFYKKYEKVNKAIEFFGQNMCSDNSHRLKHPGVPVTLIYNRSFNTRAAYLINQPSKKDIKDNKVDTKEQSGYNTVFSGGDGTVTGDSALFPAVVWNLQHKHNSQKYPRVNILDYCAPVADDGHKYTFNKKNLKEKDYLFLPCECREQSFYKKNMGTGCTHAEMLLDRHVKSAISKIVKGEEEKKEFSEEIMKKNYEKIKGKEDSYYLRVCASLFNSRYFEESSMKKYKP